MIKKNRVSLWLGNFATSDDLLAGFSYDFEIIPQFEEFVQNRELSQYNSIFLLYNFEYQGEYGNKRMEYIGCADFSD